MFPTVYFDITGGCNAKCPLCVTARLTFGKRLEFIAVPDFARAIDRLVELGLADASSCIKLYNWGEPILHPDIKGILSVLSARGLKAGFSTNASKKLDVEDSSMIAEYIFSIPGFSQDSYDRIHGLRFDRVLHNMNETVRTLRATGFTGQLTLAFHTYQFNIIEEFNAAQNWCEDNQVQFMPYYAYVNDYEVAKKYLRNSLTADDLKQISQKLMLHYVDDTLRSAPDNWQCPQWQSVLALDHRSNVLLCCVVSDENPAQKLGSVFDLGRDQILRKKTHNKECGDCLGSGCAYWAHNPKMLPARELPARNTQSHRIDVEEVFSENTVAVDQSSAWLKRLLTNVRQSLHL